MKPSSALGCVVLAAMLCGMAVAQPPDYSRIRPSAVYFDLRPYNTVLWSRNATAGFSQLLDVTRKMSTWWTELGNVVPYYYGMPNHFDSGTSFFNVSGVAYSYAQLLVTALSANNASVLNVLNSRDTTATLVTSGGPECQLAYNAVARRVPCVFTVEAADTNFNEGSFWEEGRQYLQSTLVATAAAMNATIGDSFEGYFIHDYESLRLFNNSNSTYTYKQPNPLVRLVISDPDFAYLDAQNRSRLWLFLDIARTTFQLNITSIAVRANPVLVTDPELLQSLVNEAYNYTTDVILYFLDGNWAFASNNDAVHQYMTLAANFIRNGTYPPIPDNPNPTEAPTSTSGPTEAPSGQPTNAPTAAPTQGGGGDKPTNAPGGGGGDANTSAAAPAKSPALLIFGVAVAFAVMIGSVHARVAL